MSWEAVVPLLVVIWVDERWCRAWKKTRAQPWKAMVSEEVVVEEEDAVAALD